MQQYDLLPLLDHIPVASLDYQSWVNVGMALHHEGYPVSVWDDWSKADNRYKAGECERKWRTFSDGGTVVTGGTIYEYAKRNGWDPLSAVKCYDWDDYIEYDGDEPAVVIKDKAWVEAEKIDDAKGEDKRELITYIETLFKPDEKVGFVMKSRLDESDHKYKPADAGRHTFTAGQLLERLKKNKDETIEDALEKYDHAGGAWIRFNPLDGKGVKNDNVTDFRYALVESDGMTIEEQYGLYRELNLPIAALVNSAGKSLHAIVRIDAYDLDEYKKRVNYLYEVCGKNGLVVDQQNKNPSRLSRMPGVVRGSRRQRLVATNIGAKDYLSWVDWINEKSDDLPGIDTFDDSLVLPELTPVLIDGVLRQGHKMLLAGPSKAGKSFLLMNLAICIAEGRKFLGMDCTQGKVLYINMEIDRASCLRRIEEIYKTNGIEKPNGNLSVWNLRGRAVPMDALAPRLIHRAMKQGYIAVILDPLYKVLTGDENNASDMAKFCNQFDKICTELGCAMIYCHHHSKGAQGHKTAMDRSSGSGVFARDPDALLDLIEIDPKDVDKDLPEGATAWRMSFTLREFPPRMPLETVFEYPMHYQAEGLEAAGEKYGADADVKRERGRRTQQDQQTERIDRLIEFIINWPDIRQGNDHMTPKISDAVNYFEGVKGFSEPNIKRWAKQEAPGFVIENGYLYVSDADDPD